MKRMKPNRRWMILERFTTGYKNDKAAMTPWQVAALLFPCGGFSARVIGETFMESRDSEYFKLVYGRRKP